MKAVIFDWWGTLAFNPDGKDWFSGLISILGKDAKKLFLYRMYKQWEISDDDPSQFLTQLLKDLNKSPELIGPLKKEWKRQINRGELYPETIEILDKLKAKKIPVGIISNTIPITRQVIERLEISDYFLFILLSCEEGSAKPDLPIFKKALKILDLPSSEVLMVGDQEDADIKGGLNAGTNVLHITRPKNNLYAVLDRIREDS